MSIQRSMSLIERTASESERRLVDTDCTKTLLNFTIQELFKHHEEDKA